MKLTPSEKQVLMTALRRHEAIRKVDLEEKYDDANRRGIDVERDRVMSHLINAVEDDLDILTGLIARVESL